MIPKKAGGWGALRKAVKKGHWLSDGDSIAKHVDNRQPDFDLCGHFSKDACCCCSCLVANGIERRRVCYSGRGGDTCCDCRRCCSSTICEIYSGYGLGSACCCLEKAGNCKCFIPNCCPRKREAKADLSFGPDAGGTMPPYEAVCLKTACCCCSHGYICERNLLHCSSLSENQCCNAAHCKSFCKWNPELVMASVQGMGRCVDYSPGMPGAVLQYKARGKQFFVCDGGADVGLCDGTTKCLCCKSVGKCLCCDTRAAFPQDRKAVPCVVGLCGAMCYPTCHCDAAQSMAQKRDLYRLAGEEEVAVSPIGEPEPAPVVTKMARWGTAEAKEGGQ